MSGVCKNGYGIAVNFPRCVKFVQQPGEQGVQADRFFSRCRVGLAITEKDRQKAHAFDTVTADAGPEDIAFIADRFRKRIEQEIAETVDDRPALVNFNSLGRMRCV